MTFFRSGLPFTISSSHQDLWGNKPFTGPDCPVFTSGQLVIGKGQLTCFANRGIQAQPGNPGLQRVVKLAFTDPFGWQIRYPISLQGGNRGVSDAALCGSDGGRPEKNQILSAV